MIKKLKVLLLSTMLTVGVVGCSKNENVSTEKLQDKSYTWWRWS